MWWMIAAAFATEAEVVGAQLAAIEEDNQLPILVGAADPAMRRDLVHLDRDRDDLDLVVVRVFDRDDLFAALDWHGMRCGVLVDGTAVQVVGHCGERLPRPAEAVAPPLQAGVRNVHGTLLPRYRLGGPTKALRVARIGFALSIAAPLVPLATTAVGCVVDPSSDGCVVGLAWGSIPGVALAAVGQPMLAIGSRVAAHGVHVDGVAIDEGPSRAAVGFLLATYGGLLLLPIEPMQPLAVTAITVGYLGTLLSGGVAIHGLGATSMALLPMVGPDVHGVRYVVAF